MPLSVMCCPSELGSAARVRVQFKHATCGRRTTPVNRVERAHRVAKNQQTASRAWESRYRALGRERRPSLCGIQGQHAAKMGCFESCHRKP